MKIQIKPWKKPANCRPWVWTTLMLTISLLALFWVGLLIPGRILG